MENNIKSRSFHCVEYKYIIVTIVSDILDDVIYYTTDFVVIVIKAHSWANLNYGCIQITIIKILCLHIYIIIIL